jgi:membrane protease YdiL (CAAX protease family)
VNLDGHEPRSIAEDGALRPMVSSTEEHVPRLARPSPWPVYAVALFTFIAFNALFLAAVVAGLLAGVLSGRLPRSELEERPMEAFAQLVGHEVGVVLLGAGVSAMTLTCVALVASTRDRRPGERRRDAWARRLGLGRQSATELGLVTVGMLGLGAALQGAIGHLGLTGYGALGALQRAFASLPLASRIAAAVFVAVLPALGEELFFRGWILRRLSLAQGSRWALAASSVLFGLYHMDLVHTPTTAVLGCYLGWCALRTGSLAAPLVAHGVNNLLAALMAGDAEAVGEEWAGAMLMGGLAVTAAVVVALARRDPEAPPGEW